MSIPAAWYVVPGTSDVRWWDGAKFRAIRLIDGRVKFSQVVSATPTPFLILGIVWIILGSFQTTLSQKTSMGAAGLFYIALIVVGVFFLISAILGYRVQGLAAPTTEPVWDPRVGPFVGQTEPGFIAPGWYPGLTARFPRWWTGARWSEYQIVQKFPLPTHPLRKQQRIGLLAVCCAFVVLAMGVTVAAALINPRTGFDWPFLTAMYIVLAIVGLIVVLVMRYNIRSLTVPSDPPKVP